MVILFVPNSDTMDRFENWIASVIEKNYRREYYTLKDKDELLLRSEYVALNVILHPQHLDLLQGFHDMTLVAVQHVDQEIPDILDKLIQYVRHKTTLCFIGFSDLRGIEFLDNLKSLYLREMKAITGLSHLGMIPGLTELFLEGMDRVDLSTQKLDFSPMPQLQSISLRGCLTERLDFSEVSQLREVQLKECRVESVIIPCGNNRRTPKVVIHVGSIKEIIIGNDPQGSEIVLPLLVHISDGSRLPFLKCDKVDGEILVEELRLGCWRCGDLHDLTEKNIQAKHVRLMLSTQTESLRGILVSRLERLSTGVLPLMRGPDEFQYLADAHSLRSIVLNGVAGLDQDGNLAAFHDQARAAGFVRKPSENRDTVVLAREIKARPQDSCILPDK